MSPRHLLTQADRIRGGKTSYAKLMQSGKAHKLTREDGLKGAIAKRERHGFTGHVLTAEDRRRGGLATAAKRKAARAKALVMLALDKPSPYNIVGNGYIHNPQPAKRGSESPSNGLTREDLMNAEEVIPVADLQALGASLAGKLMMGGDITAPPIAIEAQDGAECRDCADFGPLCPHTGQPCAPAPDPFTLSALKRFRLGPLSPLSLTRSQRAQVDLMIKDGWLMATGDSMLALTEKGRQAVEGSDENSGAVS